MSIQSLALRLGPEHPTAQSSSGGLGSGGPGSPSSCRGLGASGRKGREPWAEAQLTSRPGQSEDGGGLAFPSGTPRAGLYLLCQPLAAASQEDTGWRLSWPRHSAKEADGQAWVSGVEGL